MSQTQNKKEENNDKSKRRFDIVVLGATGLAGFYVAKYLYRRAMTTNPPLQWAVAGRNKQKLLQVISQLIHDYNCEKEKEKKTTTTIDEKSNNNNNNNNNNKPEVIICDVNDDESLINMAYQTKLVINCTGPFRFLGENVVKNCAQTATNYIDLCGEPEFAERCVLKYFNKAQESGSIIVISCGYDSVPSDMGQDLINEWFINQGGVCCNVEGYLSFKMPPGYTFTQATLQAALHGIKHKQELLNIRKQLNQVEWRHNRKQINYPGMKQKIHRSIYFWANRVGKYATLFPNADASIVFNSQSTSSALLSKQGNSNKTFPQFCCYLCFANVRAMSSTIGAGVMMHTVGQRDWGRKLMLAYPWWTSFGTFSEKGPTPEQIDQSSFFSEYFGEGYSKQILQEYNNNPLQIPKNKKYDLQVYATIQGPDCGYYGTSLICIETAICLLEEESIIRKGDIAKGRPQIKGGVFTPSTVFGGTTLIPRLHKSGILFEISNRPSTTSMQNQSSPSLL